MSDVNLCMYVDIYELSVLKKASARTFIMPCLSSSFDRPPFAPAVATNQNVPKQSITASSFQPYRHLAENFLLTLWCDSGNISSVGHAAENQYSWAHTIKSL